MSVQIRVRGDFEHARSSVESLGFEVLASNPGFRVLAGRLPLDRLAQVVRLESVRSVEAIRPGLDVGSVTSQGDAVHLTPAARALGPSGGGIVVGIISDSIDSVGPGIAGSRALGDLPATILTHASGDGTPFSDEGRAMAEIVYDMAPGVSQMLFGSGTVAGATGKVAVINSMVAAGVDVIADDIAVLSEPFFQDGQVAEAVDAANAAGVAYFASAGNCGRQSYESAFRVSTGGFHDFDPGAGVDPSNVVATVPPQGTIWLELQWDDPWGAATHDYDVALWAHSIGGLVELRSCDANNLITGLPREGCSWTNTTSASVAVQVAIRRFAGVSASFLKYIVHLPPGAWNPKWDTASDAINPGAASAAGAITVAAARWNTPTVLESFSSRGPKTRLFDKFGTRLASPQVRFKPDVTGTDCVATSATFAGGVGFAGGEFCGTSASTPTVAGIAAVLLSADPTLGPEDVRSILQGTATDIDLVGPDPDAGFGLVDAFSATLAALPPIVPVLAPLAAPIVAGGTSVLSGSGFTPGFVILAFVATASGTLDFGPFTPAAGTPTSLTWAVPATLSLGNGFVTLLIVNTDQGFTQSGTQSQLLFGHPGLNIPSILSVNGVSLASLDPSIPTANVETIIAQGSAVTIAGSGFNAPLVNLFTAAGNVGPLAPLPGGSTTSFQIVVPAGTVTGPGSFQVVNSPYVGNVLSNAVSVPIGDAMDISSISQAGSTITVNGAGFSVLSVINFFAQSGGGVVNFGGLTPSGNAKIPLVIVSANRFTFQVPAGAQAGAAYVMALNPPFIPFSSTTGDPHGAFTLAIP